MVATPRTLDNISVAPFPWANLDDWTSVDDGGGYEEYHPYGTAAWRAEDSSITVSAKRYRYTGMERDDETGLALHGVRLYAPWLGSWVRCDPIGLGDGPNRYAYARHAPVSAVDRAGTETQEELQQQVTERWQRAVQRGLQHRKENVSPQLIAQADAVIAESAASVVSSHLRILSREGVPLISGDGSETGATFAQLLERRDLNTGFDGYLGFDITLTTIVVDQVLAAHNAGSSVAVAGLTQAQSSDPNTGKSLDDPGQIDVTMLDESSALQTLESSLLAKEVLLHRDITLRSRHSNAYTLYDGATPLSNVHDAFLGKHVARSSYDHLSTKLAAPGSTVAVIPEVLNALLELADLGPVEVSEIAGGQHGNNSRHYYGSAMDITRVFGEQVSINHSRLAEAESRLYGLGAKVVLKPPYKGHPRHIHVAWERPAGVRVRR